MMFKYIRIYLTPINEKDNPPVGIKSKYNPPVGKTLLILYLSVYASLYQSLYSTVLYSMATVWYSTVFVLEVVPRQLRIVLRVL